MIKALILLALFGQLILACGSGSGGDSTTTITSGSEMTLSGSTQAPTAAISNLAKAITSKGTNATVPLADLSVYRVATGALVGTGSTDTSGAFRVTITADSASENLVVQIKKGSLELSKLVTCTTTSCAGGTVDVNSSSRVTAFYEMAQTNCNSSNTLGTALSSGCTIDPACFDAMAQGTQGMANPYKEELYKPAASTQGLLQASYYLKTLPSNRSTLFELREAIQKGSLSKSELKELADLAASEVGLPASLFDYDTYSQSTVSNNKSVYNFAWKAICGDSELAKLVKTDATIRSSVANVLLNADNATQLNSMLDSKGTSPLVSILKAIRDKTTSNPNALEVASTAPDAILQLVLEDAEGGLIDKKRDLYSTSSYGQSAAEVLLSVQWEKFSEVSEVKHVAQLLHKLIPGDSKTSYTTQTAQRCAKYVSEYSNFFTNAANVSAAAIIKQCEVTDSSSTTAEKLPSAPTTEVLNKVNVCNTKSDDFSNADTLSCWKQVNPTCMEKVEIASGILTLDPAQNKVRECQDTLGGAPFELIKTGLTAQNLTVTLAIRSWTNFDTVLDLTTNKGDDFIRLMLETEETVANMPLAKYPVIKSSIFIDTVPGAHHLFETTWTSKLAQSGSLQRLWELGTNYSTGFCIQLVKTGSTIDIFSKTGQQCAAAQGYSSLGQFTEFSTTSYSLHLIAQDGDGDGDFIITFDSVTIE